MNAMAFSGLPGGMDWVFLIVFIFVPAAIGWVVPNDSLSVIPMLSKLLRPDKCCCINADREAGRAYGEGRKRCKCS